ncbi:MAG: DUF1428 domain-containing protein [Phycisphaerae bacterium]|nr:DUF1428 domain-containing protein [Phycisphaerae bacterium]
MSYVDGFVLPLPTKNVAEYRALARKAAKLWKEHGALEYYECLGDDLNIKGGPLPFPKMVKTKSNETVVLAMIHYKSRAHRDKVNASVMNDPRIHKMMAGKKMPFDCKKMAYGGFKVIVKG